MLFARFVVGLAYFFLDFSGVLFEIAGCFAHGIAGHFAGGFFDSTFDFVLGTFDAIFVLDILLP